MAANNITPAQIPPGPILEYYGDIASGAIRPEDVRIEDLSFEVVIGADGSILSQTEKITVVSRYSFAIKRVYASLVEAADVDAAKGLVKFNLQEQGRNFTVFKRPVDIGAILTVKEPLYWDGVYICVPGTDFEAVWSVNQARWAALVGASRILSVSVTGDYIACDPVERR
ncbi:MAG: hypothetical protein HC882_00340 [Acidobacteria bacterium]|nr:hypothetical protein [Acidobacteriota bacterium]